jgi:hypothetical protein
MKTFVKTFAIDEALRWEIYKTILAEELFDRTAADSGCPQEITGSAYTGEVQVRDGLFVVTLTEGETP